VIGECGQRGGFVECLNIDPDVIAEMYKVASINLCTNTSGQILVDLMVDPPKRGDPSWEVYEEETRGTYGALLYSIPACLGPGLTSVSSIKNP